MSDWNGSRGSEKLKLLRNGGGWMILFLSTSFMGTDYD